MLRHHATGGVGGGGWVGGRDGWRWGVVGRGGGWVEVSRWVGYGGKRWVEVGRGG